MIPTSSPRPRRWSGLTRLLCCLAGVIACGAFAADRKPGPAVRVDTSQLVDLPAWAGQAAAIITNWYPRIAGILGETPAAEPPAITLRLVEGDGVAGTADNEITVMAGWVRAHPDDLGLVIHELVHVVQAYPSPDPGWVTEGIADYIRFWHFEKDPQTRIDPATASYRDGYRTTGAFFAWLERRHPGMVRRLQAAMRRSQYQDRLFQDATGRTLDQLWQAFLAQWRNPD